MLLKDAKIGDVCIIEHINLPFQMERRLEALGMTKETPVSVVNRKQGNTHNKAKGYPLCARL